MEKFLGIVSALTPLVAAMVYGVRLRRMAGSPNIASWFMWGVLNCIIAFSMYAAGNKNILLPVGYTCSSLFVTSILFSKGNWKWGYSETVCALGSLAAILFRFGISPSGAVVVSITAMWIASIPIIRDACNEPDLGSWWLWAAGAAASVIAIVLARSWSIEDRWFPVSSFLFNGGMTFLSLRRITKPIEFSRA